MSLASVIGWVVLAPVAVADGMFLTEMVLGLLPRRRRGPAPTLGQGTAAVLVPAHNEAPTFRSSGGVLAALVGRGVRVLVVADNCADDTAEAARSLGLEVTERTDAVRRGKGYALAHGREVLAADPPDAVVVVDADCAMDRASVELVAARARDTGRPVQATDLIRPDRTGGPTVQISGFAMLVKNLIRQRGADRLAGAAILNGTGMAFPWKAFAGAHLATGAVVEDLALGVEMVCAGRAPLYEDGANVWSSPSSESGTREQRARWEGGFLSTAGRHAPGLILGGLRRLRGRELWLGLHLLVPPLALLMSVNTGLLLLLLLLGMAGAGFGPAVVAGLLLAACGAAVVAAWLLHGRPWLSARVLARVPLYVAWKLGLYVRLALGRQRLSWTRTERVERND